MSIDFTSMSQQNHPHLPGHQPAAARRGRRLQGTAEAPLLLAIHRAQDSDLGSEEKTWEHHGVGLWVYGIKIMAD